MKIAIVDDEQDLRHSVSEWLKLSGFETECYGSAREALDSINASYPGIVVTDIKMPDMDGMSFLKRLMAQDSALPVIMVSGHGDIPTALRTIRLGAFDFIEKPFDPDRVLECAQKAANLRRQALECRALRRDFASGDEMLRRLIGSSPAMQRLREDIVDLGQADNHVLIDGETGTGKTTVAKALHAVGPRASKRFVSVFCSAHSEKELDQILFGPAPGDDPPAVDAARGGTLCLEDIEELPRSIQARLLKFVTDQGTPPQTRIIAICNDKVRCDTLEEVIRADLFYRLSALTIIVPPLRERGNDVLSIFHRFAQAFAEEYGSDPQDLTTEETALILRSPWPGNVRQLENVAERAALQNKRGSGSLGSLLLSDTEGAEEAVTTEGRSLKAHVEAYERVLIESALKRHRGSISAALEELGVPRRTLNEKMARHGLNRKDYA